MESLRSQLLLRTEKLSAKHIESMLEKTFPFIESEDLCEVPVHLLKQLPEIPEKFRQQLAESPAIFQKCAIETKRHVWEGNLKLFARTLLPLLRTYTQQFHLLVDAADTVSLRAITPQSRWRLSVRASRLMSICVCLLRPPLFH